MKEKLIKLKNGFLGLPKKKKVELTAAVVLSCSLIASIPVTAWFGYQRRIIKLQKIDSPNTLILSAAHGEDTMFFNIDGIDADEKVKNGAGSELNDTITHKDYVFCVAGEGVNEFTIQLAYTTNNPFTYEIYAADELTSRPAYNTNTEAPFVEYTYMNSTISGMPDSVSFADVNTSSTLYYKINTTTSDYGKLATGQYQGSYLNSDAEGDDATNAYHIDTYSNYTESYVHKDAEPIYWQATGIKAIPGTNNPRKEAFSRHFILRVKWNAGALQNTTKETDIVYITVKTTR